MGTHRFLMLRNPAAPCAPGMRVSLPEEEAHHARTVLRLREGDSVSLFDGEGTCAEARIALMDRKAVEVDIVSAVCHPRPVPHVAVAFAPPKGKRTPATVEALTELGADELIPLITARSVAEGGSPDKWVARTVEACKQCGRAWLPAIGDARSVKQLAARAAEFDRIFIASLTPDALPMHGLAGALHGAARVLWCVGPEGGWTPEEEALLADAGARAVRIAPHVLRIGTAAELAVGLVRFLSAQASA